MLTQFERFMGGPTRSARDRVHVTINHRGEINLNRIAFELLGEPAAVALAYDKKNNVIAVEPARPQLPEAFPLYAKTGVWVIHAAPFCRHVGIRLDRAMKFDDAKFLSDRTLLLDLRNLSQAGWKVYKPRRV